VRVQLVVACLGSTVVDAEESLQDGQKIRCVLDALVDLGARCLLWIPVVLTEPLQNGLLVLVSPALWNRLFGWHENRTRRPWSSGPKANFAAKAARNGLHTKPTAKIVRSSSTWKITTVAKQHFMGLYWRLLILALVSTPSMAEEIHQVLRGTDAVIHLGGLSQFLFWYVSPRNIEVQEEVVEE